MTLSFTIYNFYLYHRLFYYHNFAYMIDVKVISCLLCNKCIYEDERAMIRDPLWYTMLIVFAAQCEATVCNKGIGSWILITSLFFLLFVTSTEKHEYWKQTRNTSKEKGIKKVRNQWTVPCKPALSKDKEQSSHCVEHEQAKAQYTSFLVPTTNNTCGLFQQSAATRPIRWWQYLQLSIKVPWILLLLLLTTC